MGTEWLCVLNCLWSLWISTRLTLTPLCFFWFAGYGPSGHSVHKRCQKWKVHQITKGKPTIKLIWICPPSPCTWIYCIWNVSFRCLVIVYCLCNIESKTILDFLSVEAFGWAMYRKDRISGWWYAFSQFVFIFAHKWKPWVGVSTSMNQRLSGSILPRTRYGQDYNWFMWLWWLLTMRHGCSCS